MPAEHVGELAELYALGTLEPLEAKSVEAHARECASCAARLGAAEATVSRLIDADQASPANGAELRPLLLQRRGASVFPRTWAWAAGVAAAFVVGLLVPSVAPIRQRDTQPAAMQQAATAMLAGHFAHVPLRPRTPDAPKAKVVYPLEGGWLYAIVGAGAAVDVAVVRAGATTTIASLPSSRSVRMAFVKMAGREDAVELIQRGRIVASGPIPR